MGDATDNRFYREPSSGVAIPAKNCRAYSDALADVLCWFSGFAAGRPEAVLPPGLDRLRELNIILKKPEWSE